MSCHRCRMVCWFSERKLKPNGRYLVRQPTREVRAVVQEVRYKVNVNSLHRLAGERDIGMNDLGRLRLRSTAPLCFDSYRRN